MAMFLSESIGVAVFALMPISRVWFWVCLGAFIEFWVYMHFATLPAALDMS